MKIQLLKSIQIAGNHCEMFDVVDVDGATADELLASKRAIAYTEKEKPKRIKNPKNVNSK